ncbi:hypothetical protein [Bacillus fonticola]|uniref:hypothetical protein n=1 Tax=Bacillus fonticola TaxID=2728853 RepID=UPI0014740280|nr:hypothetical protein [Bacillus fonticola]
MSKKKNADYLTQAPKKEQISAVNDAEYSNLKDGYAGDSVNDHKALETANRDLAREEIQQQSENL